MIRRDNGKDGVSSVIDQSVRFTNYKYDSVRIEKAFIDIQLFQGVTEGITRTLSFCTTITAGNVDGVTAAFNNQIRVITRF